MSDFTCTPPCTVFLKYTRVLEKIEMIFSFAGVFLPTSFHHAHFVTLPKTTGLAALPPIPVYSTLIGCWAHIVIVTWNGRKSITSSLPCVQFRFRLFSSQEHSIHTFNGSEMEKNKNVAPCLCHCYGDYSLWPVIHCKSLHQCAEAQYHKHVRASESRWSCTQTQFHKEVVRYIVKMGDSVVDCA